MSDLFTISLSKSSEETVASSSNSSKNVSLSSLQEEARQILNSSLTSSGRTSADRLNDVTDYGKGMWPQIPVNAEIGTPGHSVGRVHF